MATNTDKLPPDVGGDVQTSAPRDAFDGLSVIGTVAMIMNAVRRCTEHAAFMGVDLGVSDAAADAIIELGGEFASFDDDDIGVAIVEVNGVEIRAAKVS